MLHDRVRMEAFQKAIFAAIEHLVQETTPTALRPLRVLDVGAGYGILSYWAVEGVRKYCPPSLGDQGRLPIRVYAVEGNPVTAGEAYKRLDERNVLWKGVPDHGEVLVLNTSSYRVAEYLGENRPILKRFDPELRELYKRSRSFKEFDLIISETLGSIGDNEDLASILDHAIENFLSRDGLVIPFNVKSFLVPIESRLSQNLPGQSEEIGIHQAAACSNYHSISEYDPRPVSNNFDMFFDSIIPSSDHLSQPMQIKEWQFEYDPPRSHDRSRIQYSVERSYTVTKAGLFSGFKGFFVVDLVDPGTTGQHVTIDISSDNIELHTTTDCWKHLYLPVEKQVRVDEGAIINLTFKRMMTSPDEELGFRYLWEGMVEHNGLTQDTFTQSHKTTTPFMIREPLISRFVEGFAFSLEMAHLDETMIPASDLEAKKILKHSLMNDLWDGLQTLKKSKKDDPDREELLRKYSRYAEEALSDQRLKKCFLAFPSSAIEGDKYILVSAQGNGNAFMPADAQMVVYKVDKELEPEHFVSVNLRPYDARYLDVVFDQVSLGKIFASALIIPADAYRALSVEDIKDLPALMHFLQVRIFVDIISADAQGRRAFAHQYRLTHELKQLADAISGQWMVPPPNELKERAVLIQGLAWRDTPWKVIPFPNLIESVGRMITLWSGYYNPRGVFLTEQAPPTPELWIRACWELVKENVKVTACWEKSVQGSKNIKEITARFQFVESHLCDALSIRSSPEVNKLLLPWAGGRTLREMDTDDAQLCENWMHFTRWLVSVMYNYIKHGEVKDQGLLIRLEITGKDKKRTLELTAANSNREQEDLREWWPSREFDKSVYKSWTAVEGSELQQELARRLGTQSKTLKGAKDYSIGIPVAMARLLAV